MRRRPALVALLICGSFLISFTLLAVSHRTPMVTATMDLSWQPSSGAASYDLYLGTSNPPRLYARGITSTTATVSGLAAGTTYYWFVSAHASCDPSRTTETTVKSFATAGACGGAGPMVLSTPLNGDASVSPTATLSWSESAGAGSYDLYLGSGASSPPLYLADLQQTRIDVPGLSAGAEYIWRVVARAACDLTRSSTSEIRRFTIRRDCAAPSAPAIVSVPTGSVAVGATYTINWNEPDGFESGGTYLVERSTDSAFTSIIDAQETSSRSASFISTAEDTYYHRVRAVAACDSTKRSAASEAKSVNVTSGPPVVVFTLQPQAVITKLGERLEDQKTSFALENLGRAPVQVLIAPQLLGSVPFFTIVDPFGGDSSFVTVEPRKAKTFDIHFSGPPNDQAGTYQGTIYVTSAGQPLAFTPQAYINLKVGGDANAAAPKLLFAGLESELAVFPPVNGDDSARPAITVDILNSGDVPMEVAAEIGPEAWLSLEKDWNATPIPARSFRPVRLTTRRTRAVSGSALPRYTYLTVRNKAGQSARILVEDSGAATVTKGRGAPLGPGESSTIVPWVKSGNTMLQMTNPSSDAVPVEIAYTPEGADGFDPAKVNRAVMVVPGNDVVTLSDALGQLFGITADQGGALELRVASEKVGMIVTRAEVRTNATGGGSYTWSVPVLGRGEGARLGSGARLTAIASSSGTKTSLVLVETSGREKTTAHVVLFDKSGTKRGEQTIELSRYGAKRYDDIAQAFASGAAIDGGRIEIDIPSGGGSVVGLATVGDRTSGSGATFVSQPVASTSPHLASTGSATATTKRKTVVIPGIVTKGTTKTLLGIVAGSSGDAEVKYRDAATGQTTTKSVTLTAGQTIENASVVEELFNSSSAAGMLSVTVNEDAAVYARAQGTGFVDALPVVWSTSEATTGGASRRPLYGDGLQQSIDSGRGKTSSVTLAELGGASATVTVRLYEAGNRAAAIAEKDFTVGALSELRIDNIFAATALETTSDDLQQRRKNRVNVAAVVVPKSGGGTIVAEATLIDNRTGERRTSLLVPAGGISATATQRGTPSGAGRRRAVGR